MKCVSPGSTGQLIGEVQSRGGSVHGVRTGRIEYRIRARREREWVGAGEVDCDSVGIAQGALICRRDRQGISADKRVGGIVN